MVDRSQLTAAYKVLALSGKLSACDKSVAAMLMTSYEHHQRLPPMARIGEALRLTPRTINRSVEKLCGAENMFLKIEDGEISYQPNWQRFNDLDREWEARKAEVSAIYASEE